MRVEWGLEGGWGVQVLPRRIWGSGFIQEGLGFRCYTQEFEVQVSFRRVWGSELVAEVLGLW